MKKVSILLIALLTTGCAGMPPEMQNYLIDLGKQAGHSAVNTAVTNEVNKHTAPTEECKIYRSGDSIKRKCKLK